MDDISQTTQPSEEPAEEKGSDDKSQGGSFIFELVKVVLWALLIIIPVRTFLFQPFFVQGASMEPNFFDGEYLLVNELGYKQTKIGVDGFRLMTINPFRDLMRGDVVVFRYPKNPKQFFIKRVVGLPGEKVEIHEGTVTIFNEQHPQGEQLNEGMYLPSFVETAGNQQFQLKTDEFLVLGDNRTHSSDSRMWGPVPSEDIIGKVALRAWPLDRLTLF